MKTTTTLAVISKINIQVNNTYYWLLRLIIKK